MRQFRVALYCSGNQPTAWDTVYGLEFPRPIYKISQPVDLCTALEYVDRMRALDKCAFGIVADSRPLVEFFSQPKASFEAKLHEDPHLEAAAAAAVATACPQMLAPSPAVLSELASHPPHVACDITLGPPPPHCVLKQKLSPDKSLSSTWWEWLLALLFGRPEEDCCGK